MAKLREFQAADFERLYELDQACFDAALAYSRQELRFYTRHPTTFTLVAGEGETIVGFVIGHRRRGGIGHIITIDVDAKARRAGVGTLLMDAAETRLREQGSPAVMLETAVDNVAAIRFYMRRGYSISHTLRGYYSNGLDALVMRKELM